MERILGLLQLGSRRAAKIFLVGSATLFLYGAYQALVYGISGTGVLGLPFFALWFVVTGGGVGVAVWALFSERGRSSVAAVGRRTVAGRRGVLWYLKFFLACYAAALATVIVGSVMAMPFIGSSGLSGAEESKFGFYLLLAAIGWAPVMFRYLK